MIEILLIYAIIPLIKIAVIVLFLSGAIAYLTLLERKLIAHIQVRLGPMRVGWHGLLQPIADGLKFLLKEDIVPAKADAFIFTIAPAISLLPAFLVFAVVPFGPPDMLKGFLSWILGWFPFLNLDPETIARIAENSIASGGYVTDINIAVLFICEKIHIADFDSGPILTDIGIRRLAERNMSRSEVMTAAPASPPTAPRSPECPLSCRFLRLYPQRSG